MLEYVDEKSRLAVLQKTLKAWQRKVAIQEMAFKRFDASIIIFN